MMLIYVIACESFRNCPTHDGGSYSRMLTFDTEQEIMEWALANLNEEHGTDILSVGEDSKLELSYEPSGHKYVGIRFSRDGKVTHRTVDDGRGKMIWEVTTA